MKKILLLTTLFLFAGLGFAAFQPVSVAAHDDDTGTGSTNDIKTRGEEIKTKIREFSAATSEKRLTVAKDICTNMADQRIRAVEAAKTRIASSDLTDEQKADLTKKADEALANLNTYKAECTSATTVEGVKAVVKKIKDIKVFKWLLPRAYARKSLDKTQAFIGRLTNHTATIQKHIDKAETAGCDVTGAEAALAEYTAAVKEAQTHLNLAKDVVASVGETTDPGATKREEIKAHMREMRDALLKARDAHKKIIAELKECRTAETEPGT